MTRTSNLSIHSLGSWHVVADQESTASSEKVLPFHTRAFDRSGQVSLELHPLPEKDGIIISINPPKEPKQNIHHVPCDIVLVIDVSGSMNAAAPTPATENSKEQEDVGLSVLDLVKHSARTIVETLNDQDRLGIVTYSNRAKVVQKLLCMNTENKNDTISRIKKLGLGGATNMWHGIKEGIQLFQDASKSDNITALMVMTDGMPNHMCPPQGYVPKLRSYSQLPATIHTFGFGYSIRSGLLKSIAEVGGGNYAFIPDSGMLGTTFIHAVANLQNTYAFDASLTVSTSHHLRLRETCGETVERVQAPSVVGMFANDLVIPLGYLQYGHSREIYLQYVHEEDETEDSSFDQVVSANLTCSLRGHGNKTLSTYCNINDFTPMSSAWVTYHRMRSNICSFISSLYPLNPMDGEHIAIKKSELTRPQFELNSLISNYKSFNLADEFNASILSDLCGDEPHGQIKLALSNSEYWQRWGRHYLLSLWNAHAKQICNSFKVPGPLMYGRDAPLFIKCRDEMDNAFDNLPAPTPSRKPTTKSYERNKSLPSINMRTWNISSNLCFTANCKLRMADGGEREIDTVRPGMKVWTPVGPRVIVHMVKNRVAQAEMCVLGDLRVTPWHPVEMDTQMEGRHEVPCKWVFPADISTTKEIFNGSIYSLMLQRDSDERAHSIRIDNITAVTLGHGVLAKRKGDSRAHDFFGNYDLVLKSLKDLPKDENGISLSKGVKRGINDLVNGFEA